MGAIWDLGRFGDAPVMIDDQGSRMTYAELDRKSRELAGKIDGRCLVFALCRNTAGSVLGYVAFINNFVVPVMINSHLEEGLLQTLMETYKPSYLWVPCEQIGQFPGMAIEHEDCGYVLLKTGYGKRYALHENLGLLITTSGSTGSPKLVRQSYENVLDNAKSIVEYLKIDARERPISSLPMNYVYGLSVINSHLLVGATLLLTDNGIMQREFWRFFREAEATSLAGVPYTYEMLDRLRFYRMKLPSLQTLTQAGGKLPPELHEKLAAYARDAGKQFVVMYGAAEATARMGYLPSEKAVEKRGAMGIPIPGGRFRLVGEDGKEIHEPHKVGELIYEGKNVALGYAECGDDLAKGDENHGVLETGDMALFDEEGIYFVVGRKKRFLKIYGNRVNLDEIDRMIFAKFGIEVASSGVDDHMYIFVTEEEFAEPVRKFVIDKTRLNPAAYKVVLVSEIPKNDSGKTLYKELEKFYD